MNYTCISIDRRQRNRVWVGGQVNERDKLHATLLLDYKNVNDLLQGSTTWFWELATSHKIQIE